MPDVTRSPPTTDLVVPPTVEPLTKKIESLGMLGNPELTLAMTSVPVTAVLDVPLLPDMVPTSAKRAPFSLNYQRV